jgi:hypothetical protein
VPSFAGKALRIEHFRSNRSAFRSPQPTRKLRLTAPLGLSLAHDEALNLM